jgi:ribosomal protein L11 methyltransferase
MPFYEIEFPLAGLDPEVVETALFDRGASSITLVDRGDEPVLEPRPGEIRLWSDTLVRALFDATADAAADATRHLAELEGLLGGEILRAARVRSVADQAWERVWLNDWKPMRFGQRLWVTPWAAALPDDPTAVVVRLDPGLAFGTGTHPTTALCLEALAELDLRQKSVVDYGCGSGILGIAALKLGAATVTAVDLDPQALLASRDNAERNGVSPNLVTQDTAQPVPSSDCVVANILAGPLLELRPVLTRACKAGGVLLLSGILAKQADEVIEGYRPWFDIVDAVRREDWCRIRAIRRVATSVPGVS